MMKAFQILAALPLPQCVQLGSVLSFMERSIENGSRQSWQR
jgi:hypothetical protein